MAQKEDDGNHLDRMPLEEFLRVRSVQFLECAISLMLVEMTDAEVAGVLRDAADDLETPGV